MRAGLKELHSFPVGQSAGTVREESSVREVMLRLQTELLETMERMAGLEVG